MHRILTVCLLLLRYARAEFDAKAEVIDVQERWMDVDLSGSRDPRKRIEIVATPLDTDKNAVTRTLLGIPKRYRFCCLFPETLYGVRVRVTGQEGSYNENMVVRTLGNGKPDIQEYLDVKLNVTRDDVAITGKSKVADRLGLSLRLSADCPDKEHRRIETMHLTKSQPQQTLVLPRTGENGVSDCEQVNETVWVQALGSDQPSYQIHQGSHDIPKLEFNNETQAFIDYTLFRNGATAGNGRYGFNLQLVAIALYKCAYP